MQVIPEHATRSKPSNSSFSSSSAFNCPPKRWNDFHTHSRGSTAHRSNKLSRLRNEHLFVVSKTPDAEARNSRGQQKES